MTDAFSPSPPAQAPLATQAALLDAMVSSAGGVLRSGPVDDAAGTGARDGVTGSKVDDGQGASESVSFPPLPRAAVRWLEREVEASLVETIAGHAGIPSALARVLAGRGVTDGDTARSYLTPQLKALPDPLRLAGLEAALERVVHAVQKGEHIGVFGDYDVDGVTSTVLLSEFLESIGAQVSATIPDRLLEGYGLSKGGVDRLAAAGATLIITVDCGVTAHEEVAYATSRGLDVVVIDHHTVPVTLPRAVSVINPHRTDCTRGSEMLCAVGVTFNLCLAVRRRLRERGFFGALRPEPDLKDALDLVALGTVADVVPLVGENRVLVANGLRALKQGKRAGLRALLGVSGTDVSRIDAGTLGFQLGPRVNAAGRLGDAMQAVALLRSQDEGAAQKLARALDDENASRRDIEKKIVADAIRQVEQSALLRSARVLVVGDEAWHPGVVGIVASRLVDRFGRPAVVVGQGGRGSGRSIERFPLYDALRAISARPDGGGLEGFGGHAHAAGVRLKPGALETFRAALCDYGEQVLSSDDLHKQLSHDGVLEVADVDFALCQALTAAAPFGRRNPEPLFLFRGVRATSVREVGAGHVKAVINGERSIELIAFNAFDRVAAFSGPMDVLATPEVNVFRGQRTLQLRVRDLR